MRAVCFTEMGKQMEVREVPDPSPGPGELVIRVKGCGICGSDLHVTELPGAIANGCVMGHEFAGEIAAVGKDARGPGGSWKEGDRVCTMPAISCGECARCVTGDVMGCEKLRATGFGEIGGGYAEYALAADHLTFRLPENVASADGAMVEPLSVGLHAVEAAAPSPGEDVLVLGAGPVGLSIALWAKHLGAREVVISDPLAHRRELATRLGATALIDPSGEEVPEAFHKITGHAPRMIFECVGRPGMIQDCVGLAQRGGKILSAGMCMQPDTLMPVLSGAKELTIQFVSYYRHADFALTVDMLGAGRIDPAPMVTDRIELDSLPAAFEALRKPSTECKVIVEP